MNIQNAIDATPGLSTAAQRVAKTIHVCVPMMVRARKAQTIDGQTFVSVGAVRELVDLSDRRFDAALAELVTAGAAALGTPPAVNGREARDAITVDGVAYPYVSISAWLAATAPVAVAA